MFIGEYVVHKNVVGGSSMIGFPLVIAVSEQYMPGSNLGFYDLGIIFQQEPS